MDKEEECLGKNCRWFEGKPDSLCFKVGVLPHCGPKLKAEKKKKEEEVWKDITSEIIETSQKSSEEESIDTEAD